MAEDPQTLAVSLVCGHQRVDVLLPATLPVAELLPGMVANVGQLTATSATYGFDVSASSGRTLSAARSLAAQNVPAGSVLTLVPRSEQDLRRYDDLTEAVGVAVESLRAPWGRTESLALSVGAATVLSLAAAAILLLHQTGGVAPVLAGAAAAVIVGLSAGAAARAAPLPTTYGLVVGACALLGAAGASLAAPLGLAGQAVAGGAGIGLACASAFLLPRNSWAMSFGPLLVAACLAVSGALVFAWHVPWSATAALFAALTVVLVSILPSVGLALIATRRLALMPDSTAMMPRDQVTTEVARATLAVTALRFGAGVVLIAVSPLLAHTWWGIALVGCCAASLAIGVRSLYSRLDVFANTAAAFTALLVAGFVAVWSRPVLALVLCGVLVACIVILVLHSIAPVRYRPSMERVLDAVYLVVTIAVIPLASVVWRTA